METQEQLSRCQLCEKSDENLSLYGANHKDLGWIEVCRDCWTKLYHENRLVAGSGGKSCNACSNCPY